MADNLPKRQIPGDAKWLSAAARLSRREGHGNISDELNFKDVIDKAIRDALEQIKWGMSQLQRGCTNKIIGLRADCWAPEPRETFGGLSQPVKKENDELELLKPNRTYYVRTNKPTAITLWLPDATKSDGEPVEVKDADGAGSTRNITIRTLRGQTIDGASTFTITSDYGSAMFRSNGQQWYTVARKNTADASGDVTASGTLTADKLVAGNGGTSVKVTAITRDASENLTGIGTISTKAHTLTHATLGTTNFSVVQTGGATVNRVGNRVQTTDGTVTTLHTFDLSAVGTHYISVRVAAARTDQQREHTFMYEAGYNNQAGTVTLIGAAHINSNQGDYSVAMTISGTSLLVEVTGIVAHTVNWDLLPISYQAVTA